GGGSFFGRSLSCCLGGRGRLDLGLLGGSLLSLGLFLLRLFLGRRLGLRLQDSLLLLVSDEGNLRFLHLDGGLGVLLTLEGSPVAGELEESSNLLGRLCADAEPVLGTL